MLLWRAQEGFWAMVMELCSCQTLLPAVQSALWQVSNNTAMLREHLPGKFLIIDLFALPSCTALTLSPQGKQKCFSRVQIAYQGRMECAVWCPAPALVTALHTADVQWWDDYYFSNNNNNKISPELILYKIACWLGFKNTHYCSSIGNLAKALLFVCLFYAFAYTQCQTWNRAGHSFDLEISWRNSTSHLAKLRWVLCGISPPPLLFCQENQKRGSFIAEVSTDVDTARH